MNLPYAFLATATDQTTSGSLNYVVIGLIIIVVLLVIFALKGNK